MRPISVAFVDDHPVLLSGLRSLFANVAGFEVVATGVTAGDAIHITIQKTPDIVVMDLNMPGNAFATNRADHSQLRKHQSGIEHAVMALDAGRQRLHSQGQQCR